MILVSSSFNLELRWIVGNVGRALLVALVLTPLVTAMSLAISWPLEGWSGSAIETYLGWTLPTLPYVIILGSPALVAVLAAIRFRRPSRYVAIALSVVLGDGVFAALLTRHWDRDPGIVTVAQAALTYLPLWLVYGAILRLQSVRAQVTLAHAE